jgi:primosomal protein N' (replication factor Y)
LRHVIPGQDFRTEGPAPAPLARLRGRFRWQLLAFGQEATALRAWVRKGLAAFRGCEAARQVQVHVDPDPATLC